MGREVHQDPQERGQPAGRGAECGGARGGAAAGPDAPQHHGPQGRVRVPRGDGAHCGAVSLWDCTKWGYLTSAVIFILFQRYYYNFAYQLFHSIRNHKIEASQAATFSHSVI